MEVTKIPPKDLRFMLGLRKPNSELTNSKINLHSFVTVILLGLCCYVFTPILLVLSIFIVLTLASFPLICCAPYELSALFLIIFRGIEIVQASMGLIYIILSLIKMEVFGNFVEMNNNTMELTIGNSISRDQLVVESIIIFLTVAVTQINVKFFQRVVLKKKEEVSPKLVISWKKLGENQMGENEPPKYDNLRFFQHNSSYPFSFAVIASG